MRARASRPSLPRRRPARTRAAGHRRGRRRAGAGAGCSSGSRSRSGARRRPGRSAPHRPPARRSRGGPRASVRSAVVLPEPATPTTQTTRSRLSAASRTSRCCSRDSPLSRRPRSTVRPSAAGAPTSRPAVASASASRSTSSSSRVVNRAGRPGMSPGSTCSTPGSRDELVGGREHLLSRRAVAERAGDGADELRLRERRLRRGQPIRREQTPRELLPVGDGRLEPGLVDEPAQLAAAEAMLGRPCEPLLTQPRQVDLLLRLARRERRDPGGGETLPCRAPPCARRATAAGSRTPGSPPRAPGRARPSP